MELEPRTMVAILLAGSTLLQGCGAVVATGVVTGAAVALVLAPVYGRLILVRTGIDIPVWQLAIIGIVVSVAGQIGDVAESLYKREAGIKDSGTFFPGHGGVLDRFDSLYWALPATVILLGIFGVT